MALSVNPVTQYLNPCRYFTVDAAGLRAGLRVIVLEESG